MSYSYIARRCITLLLCMFDITKLVPHGSIVVVMVMIGQHLFCCIMKRVLTQRWASLSYVFSHRESVTRHLYLGPKPDPGCVLLLKCTTTTTTHNNNNSSSCTWWTRWATSFPPCGYWGGGGPTRDDYICIWGRLYKLVTTDHIHYVIEAISVFVSGRMLRCGVVCCRPVIIIAIFSPQTHWVLASKK